jgi:hypothetical protein
VSENKVVVDPGALSRIGAREKAALESKKLGKMSTKSGSKLTGLGKENEDDNDDAVDDAVRSSVNQKQSNLNPEALVTVDMCSGWVMVPLAAVVQGKPIRSKIKMCGGTPFSPVQVNSTEIKKRPGTFEVNFTFFLSVRVPPSLILTTLCSIDDKACYTNTN